MSAVTLPAAPTPAQTPPPRIQASGPKPHRYTIAEYRKLYETGLFNDLKTMLIYGELFTMGLPKPPHDITLNLTVAYLYSICPIGHHVRNQQGFDIGTDNDPGPDLAVVPGSIRDATATPTVAVLVIEIAHTTLAMDTTTKAELYATAGVPEYWVLDVENRQLLVFRDPQPLPKGLGATAYRTHSTYAPADRVSTLFAPASTVLVGDLLP